MISVNRIHSSSIISTRIAFLDNVRYFMIVLVVVYHSVAAYATIVPWWSYHDTSFFAADIVRELLDVFIMPVLFFISGYFALPSFERKGARGFIKDKGKQLLIPWALAVFVICPLLLYDQPIKPFRPFWNYWLWYVSSFPVRFDYLPQTLRQGPYWFISLLFAFFVLFALVCMATRSLRSSSALHVARKAALGNSLAVLMLFGVMTSIGYFASLLLLPDTSWLTLGAFLEFQPTRLMLLADYFMLGIYAQSQMWFTAEKPLGRPALWGVASAVLSVVFLVFGQPMFTDLNGTSLLPVEFLLPFAFIRSFLMLSLLMALLLVGVHYWNRSSSFDRQLSKNSYNVYLTHIWFVGGAQIGLMDWGGPVLVKFVIVFLTSLALSFVISMWVIGRYPRASATVILVLFVFCLAVRP